MYIPKGIKASKLVQLLNDAIKKHGDKQVFAGGTDYPEGVEEVHYNKPEDGNGYVPGDSFSIW